MHTSKRSGYDEAMHSALELWLLMKLQEYLFKERLLVAVEVDLSKVWRMLDWRVGRVNGCVIWRRGLPI